MATGLEMLDALRRVVKHVPPGTEFRINRFDAVDLCTLTEADLRHRSVDAERAAEIVAELARSGNVAVLDPVFGVRLRIDRSAPGIIPGEGFRRAAELLKDDPQTLDEMLSELRTIRHGAEGRP